MRHVRLLAALCAVAAMAWAPGKKQKREQETQTLELPKEPPVAVKADARRLIFQVSPLSGKGLLSQQSRDAIRFLIKSAHGAEIVKLRAFVAGRGDMRRVKDVVSETFTSRRQRLPALSVVQVGALAREGSQVVMEAVAAARKEVNPEGLAFISGQRAESASPLDPAPPLLEKSLADLRTTLRAIGAEPADVLRITCFLSSLDGFDSIRRPFYPDFAKAALNYVQTQRAPARAFAECEAVARLRQAPDVPVRFLKPGAMVSQAALVGASTLVLTGTQVAFGFQDADARLAFQRLEKALAQSGASLKTVAMTGVYPLSEAIAAQARKIGVEFFDAAQPPASTMAAFEGLPSMDASFAIDAVAIAKR